MKKILSVLMMMAATSVLAGPIAYNTEEYRLNGSIDFDTIAGTELDIEAGYGYFFQDYTEAGVLVGVADNDYVTTLSLGGFLEYNFDTDTEFTPFVGAELSVLYSDVEVETVIVNPETGETSTGSDDESTTALALGIYAGAKYFIADNLAISARVFLEVATDDVYAEEDGLNNVDSGIDFGLRFFY